VPRSYCGTMRLDHREVAETWEDMLVAVAERRDRAAFAALFRHFTPRIKAYLMRNGASPALAEDIAQETMAAAWRKAHLYDRHKAGAATWLFTIARNQRIDHFRRETRPEPDADDPAFAPDPVVPPDRQVAAIQDTAAVQRALAQLPPAQREVIAMSFYHDDSHSIIAEKLQLPIGTVKSRIRLALKRLDDLLDRRDHGPALGEGK
jgi:RNA polymerase sigma-70 factor (ECF subfamily)